MSSQLITHTEGGVSEWLNNGSSAFIFYGDESGPDLSVRELPSKLQQKEVEPIVKFRCGSGCKEAKGSYKEIDHRMSAWFKESSSRDNGPRIAASKPVKKRRSSNELGVDVSDLQFEPTSIKVVADSSQFNPWAQQSYTVIGSPKQSLLDETKEKVLESEIYISRQELKIPGQREFMPRSHKVIQTTEMTGNTNLKRVANFIRRDVPTISITLPVKIDLSQ
jgi:hypothetical protein